MILLTMLLIPTLVAVGFLIFGGKAITIKEFLAQIGVQAVLMALVSWGISHQNTADTEILNGRITGKEKDRVHCRHSYSCNCYTTCSGSGSSRSCSTHCSTCYEHSYDIDWDVKTSLGNTFSIDTIDRQGLREPPRWTAVRIGEPYSRSHGYDNYVKASPDSLFRHQGLVEKFKDVIPQYPGKIYDYYRINRLVTLGVNVDNPKAWNDDLSELNAELGQKKQINMGVVVVKSLPQEYFFALEQAWIGSKKNDAMLVVSVDQDLNIEWADVLSWTDNKMFQVVLRDMVVGKKLDKDQILSNMRSAVEAHYVRKSMKDFEYLAALVTPTVGQWVFAMVFGLILSVGLGIFFFKQDVFNDEEDSNNYRRYYGRRW